MMIKSTFQCFDGIGDNGEARLWRDGCLCWRDFRNGAADCLSISKQERVLAQLGQAEAAYAGGALDWFLNRLKGPAALRVLHDFMSDALFLDIETTGLGPNAQVTSVATWRDGEAKCFVRGFNLDDFLAELATAKLLVTYNGKRFDLPFLRRHYGLDLDVPHLDIMYPLRALGYRGGLKVCENRLGFRRQYSSGIDGAEAVYLWRAWRMNQDTDALRSLVVYNIEDTYSLAWIAARILPQSIPDCPIKISDITTPSAPDMSEALTKLAI
jgi:uncharacterized protein